MKTITAAVLLLVAVPAHASQRQKLIDDVTAQVREASVALETLRITDPGYRLIRDARRYTLDDLEDFQSSDSKITEDQLTNDLYELRMDVHQFAEGLPIGGSL